MRDVPSCFGFRLRAEIRSRSGWAEEGLKNAKWRMPELRAGVCAVGAESGVEFASQRQKGDRSVQMELVNCCCSGE